MSKNKKIGCQLIIKSGVSLEISGDEYRKMPSNVSNPVPDHYAKIRIEKFS